MKKNIGRLDQMIRVGAAIVIAILYMTDYISGIFALALLLLAGTLFITSLFSFCPLYAIFGVRTNKISKYKKRY